MAKTRKRKAFRSRREAITRLDKQVERFHDRTLKILDRARGELDKLEVSINTCVEHYADKFFGNRRGEK